jgi:hypothetical protein
MPPTRLDAAKAKAVAKYKVEIGVGYVNQTDLENIIEATYHAALQDVREVAEGMKITKPNGESCNHKYNQALSDLIDTLTNREITSDDKK